MTQQSEDNNYLTKLCWVIYNKPVKKYYLNLHMISSASTTLLVGFTPAQLTGDYSRDFSGDLAL